MLHIVMEDEDLSKYLTYSKDTAIEHARAMTENHHLEYVVLAVIYRAKPPREGIVEIYYKDEPR